MLPANDHSKLRGLTGRLYERSGRRGSVPVFTHWKIIYCKLHASTALCIFPLSQSKENTVIRFATNILFMLLHV